MFDKKSRVVATVTDLGSVLENISLNKELRNTKLLTKSIKHEVTTPLRCVVQISDEAVATGKS